MKLNEQGATLVLVLLAFLVFSVIGMALLGNTIGERKRIVGTELAIQARNLAQNGFTYFENDFAAYMNKTDATQTNFDDFFKNYVDWVSVGSKSKPEETKIKVRLLNNNNIEVYSTGTANSKKVTLKGYYHLSYDIDGPSYEIADFNRDGTIATNFANFNVLNVGLKHIIDLSLIHPRGNDRRFYQVPTDKIFDVNLLGPILGFNFGNGDRFRTMRESRVIATRKGTILGVNLLGNKESSLVRLSVLELKENEDTNVLINGGFTTFNLLGLKVNEYRDIDFKKFAVVGNALIQQNRVGNKWVRDTHDPRRFSFAEGLYVNRSLVIGGVQGGDTPASKWENYSKLMLRGDMVTMENLLITDVDLEFGDNETNENKLSDEDFISNIYVHGDAEIKNACIRMKNENYQFGLFVKGKLTIENNTIKDGCNIFPGYYYAEKGIEIITNNEPMTIIGGLCGDVHVDNPHMLTIEENHEYGKVKYMNMQLTPQGREVAS